MTQNEQVAVEQCDRDALAAQYRAQRMDAIADWIRTGQADNSTHAPALRALAATRALASHPQEAVDCHIGSCNRHEKCMYVPCRAAHTKPIQAAESGLLDERAAIVAWLRSPAGKGSEEGVDYADAFADAIERGVHLPAKAGKPGEAGND